MKQFSILVLIVFINFSCFAQSNSKDLMYATAKKLMKYLSVNNADKIRKMYDTTHTKGSELDRSNKEIVKRCKLFNKYVNKSSIPDEKDFFFRWDKEAKMNLVSIDLYRKANDNCSLIIGFYPNNSTQFAMFDVNEYTFKVEFTPTKN